MKIGNSTKGQEVQTQVAPVMKPQVEAIVPKPVETKEQTKVEKVWGNVLVKVKENNMFALSNALTYVNKVQQIGNKLIIATNDQGSYQMIDNKERINVLLQLVNLFDDSIEDILIEYDKTNASKQDIKDSLRDVFKSKIKFKE